MTEPIKPFESVEEAERVLFHGYIKPLRNPGLFVARDSEHTLIAFETALGTIRADKAAIGGLQDALEATEGKVSELTSALLKANAEHNKAAARIAELEDWRSIGVQIEEPSRRARELAAVLHEHEFEHKNCSSDCVASIIDAHVSPVLEKIQERKAELARLRTFIAGLECQKQVTCCNTGVCEGKDKGSTHWFIGCKAESRNLPRSEWCLPCQYKEEPTP